MLGQDAAMVPDGPGGVGAAPAAVKPPKPAQIPTKTIAGTRRRARRQGDNWSPPQATVELAIVALITMRWLADPVGWHDVSVSGCGVGLLATTQSSLGSTTKAADPALGWPAGAALT